MALPPDYRVPPHSGARVPTRASLLVARKRHVLLAAVFLAHSLTHSRGWLVGCQQALTHSSKQGENAYASGAVRPNRCDRYRI